MPRIDRPIRRWTISLSVALALPVLGDPAPDGVPSAPGKSRYETLRAHSPFSMATAVALVAAPQASFASNWFVSGIARIGDADFVTIKSRDQSAAFSLYSRETDPVTGVALASVNWSDMVGKSTVILRKGTETARLEFNEADLRAAPAAQTVAAAPAKQSPNGAAAAAPRPATIPPAGAVASNLAAAPNVSAAIRRRAVPIQPPR